MRDGFKVFDADAHVVYPPDLWSRFLDARFRDRVGRRAPAGLVHYNPVTVDGRWTQHATSLYGQFQKAINWTTEDMIAKYGEELVLQGFTGDRVARALEVEGVDVMVIYGPEYDMWLEGIDPELQAAMARAYNRWGQEMREASGGRVIASGPPPAVQLQAPALSAGSTALKSERQVYFPEWQEHRPVPVYDRYLLAPGAALDGPAIIEERESTIVVGPEARIEVDSARNVSVWL